MSKSPLRRILLLKLLFLSGVLSVHLDAAAPNPNIVVLYADDLGFGDVSCNNPDRGKISTPNIDRLAAQGMRFTDGHSSSGVCSPSRYTLLTGRYHWRSRLQSGIVGVWKEPLIAKDRVTVAELLRKNGYRTACIGKWHLGWDWPIEPQDRIYFDKESKEEHVLTAAHQAAWQRTFAKPIANGPTTRGFDTYFGTDVPNWPPYCFVRNDRTVGIPSEFLPQRLLRDHQASLPGPALPDWKLEAILPALADQATRFISESAGKPEPFFLYMPLTSPHTPLAVSSEWKGKSQLGTYGDFVMQTDHVVGKVLQTIKDMGVEDNTLVLFTSDNGCAPYIGAFEMEKQGHFASGPFRGYKSDIWEGGHRVPFIVRWPRVVEAGRTSNALAHQADLFATCAEIVRADKPDDVGEDSVSLLPILTGKKEFVRETAISQSSKGLLALRKGPWKLIVGPGSGGWSKGRDPQRAQLYRLDDDVTEMKNLYEEEKVIAGELMKILEMQITSGRSTAGKPQPNDVPVKWQRFLNRE